MIPEWLFPPSSSSFKGSSWHSYRELKEREAKICFNYLQTDPCAFYTCSCPIPQVPSDSQGLWLGAPYNRTECNPLWGPLAAWSFALSPPQGPEGQYRLHFKCYLTLPQMAWPLSWTLAVCIVILLLENSPHGIFSYNTCLWSHRIYWSCSPRGRHACAESWACFRGGGLFSSLNLVLSLLCNPGQGYVFTGFGANSESSQVLFPEWWERR